MKNNMYCGAVKLSEQVEQDIERMQLEVIELIKAICTIPAPSHYEGRRAAFVRDWFENHGLDAQIDEALNVYCEWGLEDHEDIVVVMAHMDTVFPDTDPMNVYEADGRVYGPGIGDNASNLAAMMSLAAYLKNHDYQPQCGMLFVADSCEEGLGNLKGCKAIMKAYGDRVKAFISLDGYAQSACVKAVGSSRYRITVETSLTANPHPSTSGTLAQSSSSERTCRRINISSLLSYQPMLWGMDFSSSAADKEYISSTSALRCAGGTCACGSNRLSRITNMLFSIGNDGILTVTSSSFAVSFQWICFRLSPSWYSRTPNTSPGSLPFSYWEYW